MNKNCGIFLLAIAICFSVGTPDSRSEEQQKQTVHISRGEFFTGELKRLQSHLDWQTCCLKLRYNGPEVPMRLIFQQWHNGHSEDVATVGTKLRTDAEVLFSVQDAFKDGKPAYKIVIEAVTATGSVLVEKPERAFGIASRDELPPDRDALDVTIPGEAMVWAWVHHNGMITWRGSLEREAKEHDWALTMKLVFGPDAMFPDKGDHYMSAPFKPK
jgi:hypothetical protein